jgi:hypothetical protein
MYTNGRRLGKMLNILNINQPKSKCFSTITVHEWRQTAANQNGWKGKIFREKI